MNEIQEAKALVEDVLSACGANLNSQDRVGLVLNAVLALRTAAKAKAPVESTPKQATYVFLEKIYMKGNGPKCLVDLVQIPSDTMFRAADVGSGQANGDWVQLIDSKPVALFKNEDLVILTF